MLRLVQIEPFFRQEYLVTLDVDGTLLEYLFAWVPPTRPGRLPRVRYPIHMPTDLLAYQALPPDDGQPASALVIPALDAIVQAVYQVADGQPVELPIVLDER